MGSSDELEHVGLGEAQPVHEGFEGVCRLESLAPGKGEGSAEELERQAGLFGDP